MTQKPSTAQPHPSQRLQFDWDAIKRDWQERMTYRELSAKHGCSTRAIVKRAKAENWTRNLDADIRARARAKLDADGYTESGVHKNQDEGVHATRSKIPPKSPNARKSEAEIVEIAAEAVAQVERRHRGRLRYSADIVDSMTAELAGASILANHEALQAAMNAFMEDRGINDPEVRAKVISAIEGALELGSRAKSMKTLVDALEKLVGMERKSFRMDAGEDDKPKDFIPLEERLKAYQQQPSLSPAPAQAPAREAGDDQQETVH